VTSGLDVSQTHPTRFTSAHFIILAKLQLNISNQTAPKIGKATLTCELQLFFIIAIYSTFRWAYPTTAFYNFLLRRVDVSDPEKAS
jgi:hypothetical protein